MPEEWVSRLLAVSPTGSGHKGTAPAPLPAARLRLRSSLGADADPNRRLRLRWVSPAQGPDLLEIGQAGVPTIKQHTGQRKAPLLSSTQQGVLIAPQKGQRVDAIPHGVVLARPAVGEPSPMGFRAAHVHARLATENWMYSPAFVSGKFMPQINLSD